MAFVRMRAEAGPLLRLAIPLVIAQVGQMMLGVVDVALAGRLGVEALAAVSLGSVWQFGTMLPLFGVVIGLDPIVSQAHGAGRGDDAALGLQRALLIALALSVPLALSWAYTEEVLVAFGQDPALSAQAGIYLRAQRVSAPGYLVYGALSTYLSSRGIVRPGIVTMIVANLFNALAAWALMFGRLGMPALGIVGEAIATSLTRLLMPCVLTFLIVRFELYRDAWVPWSRRVLASKALALQLRLGIPNGITMGLELWAFQLGTILAGRIGPVALGAHSVALNLASLSFMVPLGFAIGTSARVGQLIGAGERERAQHAAHAALSLIATYAVVAGGTFVLAREQLPGLYSHEAPVVSAAAWVLPIAGLFQLFDGLQAAGSGILRGMGRPRVTATFNLIGYFVIGIPLAYYLGLHTALGLRGIWIGYAAGLFFVSAGLVGSVLTRGPRSIAPLAAR